MSPNLADVAAPAAYFDEVWSASAAASRAGCVERHVRLAGRVVRLRLCGRALAERLLPALAALPAAGDEALDLDLLASDRAEPGVSIPTPPWGGDDQFGNGGVRGFLEGRWRASWEPDAGLLSLFDREHGRAVVAVRDARLLPGWVAAAPFRTPIAWWAEERGALLVHAAAVGLDGRGVLLAGAGGAGKSTAALACLRDGFSYAGDDYVLISPASPRAFGVYATGKLDGSFLAARLPELLPLASGVDRFGHPKAILRIPAERFAPALDLVALLVPRRSGASPSLRSLHPGEALRALLPSSLFPVPGARAAALRTLGELVRALPAFALDPGDEPTNVPALVRRLLAGRAG